MGVQKLGPGDYGAAATAIINAGLAAIDGVSGNVAALDAEMDARFAATGLRADALERFDTSITEKVNALDAEVDSRFAAMGLRADALERFDTSIAEKVNALDAEVDSRFAATGLRADALERTDADLLDRIRRINAGVYSALRPGDTPAAFTIGDAGGAPDDLPPLTDAIYPIAVVETGVGRDLSASRDVFERTMHAVRPSAVWSVRWRYRRRLNAVDPSGDGVERYIAWYGPHRNLLDTQTIGNEAPRASDGLRSFSLVIAPAGLIPGATAPLEGAVYFKAGIRAYGLEQRTTVTELGAVEITDAVAAAMSLTPPDSVPNLRQDFATEIKERKDADSALDLRIDPFEALIAFNPTDSLDGGNLATFVDGLQRVIGAIGADATWQILQDAVRLRGGPSLAAHDTLSGEHIAIVDAAGNQVPIGILLDKVRLPGGLTIEHYETLDQDALPIGFADRQRQLLPVDLGGSSAVSAEVATARGSRVALADRVGVTLTPYGLPRDYRWGTHYLRETRERLMALKCGAARRLIVALMGDSWTQVKPYWSAAFVKALIAEFGDGGFGWTGFASTGGGIVGNARPDVVGVSRSGTWVDVTWTRPGPDLCSATSTAAGSRVTVTGPGAPALTGCDLYFYGTSDGQARYRWNGGAWTTIALTGSGLTIAPVTAGMPGSGAFAFDIEVVSGTVSLDGINLKSAASGVVVHNIACSGSRLSHHVAVDAAQYQAGIAGLAPDLVVPLLGTNDQTNSTPAIFAANYGTLIGRLRAARPLADLMMVMPSENLRGYVGDPMSGYAAAAYPVAQQQRCAWIDLQYVFGDQPSDYGSTSARPWIDPDNIHPQAGYFPISSAIFRTLAYS